MKDIKLPEGSIVLYSEIQDRFSSTWVVITYEITEEYQAKHDLGYRQRCLAIRLIKGESDEGLPLLDYANSN